MPKYTNDDKRNAITSFFNKQGKRMTNVAKATSAKLDEIIKKYEINLDSHREKEERIKIEVAIRQAERDKEWEIERKENEKRERIIHYKTMRRRVKYSDIFQNLPDYIKEYLTAKWYNEDMKHNQVVYRQNTANKENATNVARRQAASRGVYFDSNELGYCIAGLNVSWPASLCIPYRCGWDGENAWWVYITDSTTKDPMYVKQRLEDIRRQAKVSAGCIYEDGDIYLAYFRIVNEVVINK